MHESRRAPLVAGLLTLLPLSIHAQEVVEASAIESAAELYAFENLLKIEISMVPADWDKVRFDKHRQVEVGENGERFTKEVGYSYQPGDISINGKLVTKVGVRKKGFIGSVNSQRPALKIKFNGYVKEQMFAGIRRLTLNNNHQDPTQIRQYLTYQWFRRAELPAPRCNFARVYVNGKYLGIYSNVEPMGVELLEDRFGSAEGNLYESTVGDFTPEGLDGFEAKTNKKSADKDDLRKIISIISSSDENRIEQLEEHIDLEQFVKFWIAELLLGHWDGYAGNRNNFFIYKNPQTDRFVFMPWGVDQTFTAENPFIPGAVPLLIRAMGRLCSLVYEDEDYRQIYLDMVAEQLDDNWFEEELIAEADLAVRVLRPHLHISAQDFDVAIKEMKTYIEGVAPRLRIELDAPPEEWVVAPSTKLSLHADPAGTAKSEFLIPLAFFDPANAKPLPNSTIKINWRGKPVPFLAVIGLAGYSSKEPQWHDHLQMMIGGVRKPNGEALFLGQTLDPELLATTHEFELDMFDSKGWLAGVNAAKVVSVLGSLRGKARCEIVEIDGKRFLKGSMDVTILSDVQEL